MNNFSFTGNLGREAEVKYLPNGTVVCEFSVAVKSGYGEKEKTNWVRCVMFGKKAEGQLPSYLQKGTQVAINGELELQEWEGEKGKGAALSVRVDNIDLIGGKPQVQSNQAQQQHGYAPQQHQAQPQQGYAPQQQAQQQHAPQGGYQQPQQQAPHGGYSRG